MDHEQLEKQFVNLLGKLVEALWSGKTFTVEQNELISLSSQLPLKFLIRWEELIRQHYAYPLNHARFNVFGMKRKPIEALTLLDITSNNGYRREKALRTIQAGMPSEFFFALCLRRLNDWVPEVRVAARECLSGIADQTRPEHVVGALAAILPQWYNWGRLEDIDRAYLAQILSKEPIIFAFKEHLIHEPQGPLAKILSQLGNTTAIDCHLPEIAHKARQPAVRAKAYRSMLSGVISWIDGYQWQWLDLAYCRRTRKPCVSQRKLTLSYPFIDTIETAMQDRSEMVRRAAVDVYMQQLGTHGNDGKRLAQLFSSDSSTTIAKRGNYALKWLEENSVDHTGALSTGPL